MNRKKERKLSSAEEVRRVQFEKTKSLMTEKGYKTKDLTISLAYANVMALVLGLPVILVFVALFFLCNAGGFTALAWMESTSGLVAMLVLVFGILVLIVLHELIHGVTWAVFAKNHWKAISFGVIVAYITPYCACNDPLKKGQYIMGALMPTLILGVLPAAAAVITGSLELLLLSAIMILSGGGDLTIILHLVRFSIHGREAVFLDHPYLCGLVAFVK